MNHRRIATLIADLSRSVARLSVDIDHAETRAGIRDLSDPAYSTLARSLSLRIPTKSPRRTDMKSPGDSETMSPTFPI